MEAENYSVVLPERPEPEPGKWRYDAARLVLDFFDDAHFLYEVDLEQCTSSPEILDWMRSVSTFATYGKLLQIDMAGLAEERGHI